MAKPWPGNSPFWANPFDAKNWQFARGKLGAEVEMWCLMRDLIMASQTESRGVEASDRRAFPRQGIDPLDDEMGFRIRAANVSETRLCSVAHCLPSDSIIKPAIPVDIWTLMIWSITAYLPTRR